ncbi:probable isoprenylcysteine alpha-carbonyl methylesterase ICME isoform X1 [Argonauta hians]
MMREVVKNVAMMMSTVVAVPYTIAILCNLLYGWPLSRQRLKDSLSVKKVFALNYAVWQQMKLFKYFSLYIRLKFFYKYSHSSWVIKDVPYGRNDKQLDIYLPVGAYKGDALKPVVIYVFGGGWNTGDKNLYGLMCSQVADQVDAVVCCPNYSLYPQGCADDMIQDVVDAISWIHNNIERYGGNKEKILLIGHSCGAHLCVMAVLELFHDKLKLGRLGISPPNSFSTLDSDIESGSLSPGRDSSLTPGLQGGNETTHEPMDIDTPESEDEVPDSASSFHKSAHFLDMDGDDDASDNDSVVTVRAKEAVNSPSLTEMCKSIKAVIGLAGIFHINDQHEYERQQGLEDMSCIQKCMYGQDHFSRFSPTIIIESLKKNIKLPKMVLLHGTEDQVVPMTSSIKFGESLSNIFADVTVRVIPFCDHYNIFADLMSPERKLHDVVMSIVLETARRFF